MKDMKGNMKGIKGIRSKRKNHQTATTKIFSVQSLKIKRLQYTRLLLSSTQSSQT